MKSHPLYSAILTTQLACFCCGDSAARVDPTVASHDTHPDHTRSATGNVRELTAWSIDGFPFPDSDVCHSAGSNRFCDSELLLSETHHKLLGDALADSSTRVISLSDKCFSEEGTETSSYEVQYSAVLIQKMDLHDLQLPTGAVPEVAAKHFAEAIHNKWGVGLDASACGGTGVLVFLSEMDRTIYISRGAALESVLTDDRLDKVIRNMKPLLSKQLYADALLNAIEVLDLYLLEGEPQWKEQIEAFVVGYIGYAWLLVIFGAVGRSAYNDRVKRREYAKVSSHLNELDRSRAEALAGTFECKSCPICLENFQDESTHGQLLEEKTNKGSDGLPLKLLRCGHVFDETCWAEWIENGNHRKVDKCPICQQDVGSSSPARNISNNSSRVTQLHHSEYREEWRTTPEGMANLPPSTVTLRDDPSRAMRLYRRERNFRLMRMRLQYPDYIRPDQIERWTQSNYEGSMVQDRSFVNSDPVRRSTSGTDSSGDKSSRHDSGSSSFGSSSFGGGSSGGGRGGRW